MRRTLMFDLIFDLIFDFYFFNAECAVPQTGGLIFF